MQEQPLTDHETQLIRFGCMMNMNRRIEEMRANRRRERIKLVVVCVASLLVGMLAIHIRG